MSLRIWLPLTKDLRNQGLDNWIFSSYGTVTQPNTGKLGNCLQTEATGTVYNNNISLTLNGNFSIGYWLRIDAYQTSWNNFFTLDYDGNHWCGMCYNNSSNGSAIGWHVRVDINGTATNIFDRYAFTGLTVGQWYHIGLTMENGTTCKMYLNGALIYTGNTRATYPTTTYTRLILGSKNYNNSYSNCSINDFRVYDHTLSQMEVKELAKGLVLHYPLNRQGWGQENLVENTSSILRSGSIDRYYTGLGHNSTDFFGLTTGDIATFRVYLKAPAEKKVKARIQFYTDNNNRISINGNWINAGDEGYSTITWTLTAAQRAYSQMQLLCDCNDGTTTTDTFYWKEVKLEKGSIATPWCPNSSDELATTMGLNSTTEYDCSGFGNNGTRTGTFDWTSNTAKYAVSTKFNGTDNAIQTPSLPTMITDKNYTIAVWIYKTVIGSKGYQTIYGGPSGFEIEARNGSANETKFVPWNWGKPMVSYELNEWNHCVFVHSDADCKIYLNGEYIATGTAKASNPTGNYFVGAWNTATQQNFDGLMSDFRIYATALSADDVKSLYQNSAYIDSSGNVYGAVHSEV